MEPQQPQQPTPEQPQEPQNSDPNQRPQAPSPNPNVWQQDTPHEKAAAEQTFHTARPVSPAAPVIPENIRQRHEESKRKYPSLNLSPGEYVIRMVKRHPIGILGIWAAAIGLIVAIFAATIMITSGMSGADVAISGGTKAAIYLAALMLATLVTIGGFIASYVYENNKFFLTNESVIQEIQLSLFSKHEQTVSLSNIEDASYRQEGIIQSLFGYGSIRLSTEGDETTYRFVYVANPKGCIAELNNAVEAFKMGRPVSED